MATTINFLPSELLSCVAQNLGTRDLASLAKTSHRFCEITNFQLYATEVKSQNPRVLHWAAQYGVIETLNKALDAGADVKYQYKSHISMIEWDVLTSEEPERCPGHKGYLRTRRDKVGYMGETTFKYHWTALHLAVRSGHLGIVRTLLDRGAPTNLGSYGICECCTLWEGNYPIHSMSRWEPLHVAVCRGHDAIARLLLSQNASIIVERDLYLDRPGLTGLTVMHTAAYVGNIEFMRFLVNEGYQSDIDAADRSGVTPLAHAYTTRQWEALEWLVQHGGDINVRLTRGSTPLLHACSRRQLADAARLVDLGANVHILTSDGRESALHLACEWRLLPYEGWSNRYMLRASVSGKQRAGLIKRLLDEGADIEQRNDRGRTPIMNAANSSFVSALDVLISAGANLEAMDNDGLTPLMHACMVDCPPDEALEAISKLLDSGAAVDQESFSEGTALRYVCHGDKADVRKGPSCGKVVGLLLKYGANPNVRHTDTDLSPLMASFYGGDVKACRFLLEYGAKVAANDSQVMCNSAIERRWAPGITFAFESGKHDVDMPLIPQPFELLIKAIREKDDKFFTAVLDEVQDCIGLTDSDGMTLLHLVLDRPWFRESAGMVQALLKLGADVNVFDSLGDTPLSKAVAVPNAAAIPLLLEAGADPHIQPEATRPQCLSALKLAIFMILQDGYPIKILDTILTKRPLQDGSTPLGPQGVHFPFAFLNADCFYDALHEIVRTLVKHGVDPNAPDPNDDNALALFFQALLVLQQDSEHNASWREIKGYEQLALNITRIVGHLLDGGADIKAKNKAGKSATEYFKLITSDREPESWAYRVAMAVRGCIQFEGSEAEGSLEIG